MATYSTEFDFDDFKRRITEAYDEASGLHTVDRPIEHVKRSQILEAIDALSIDHGTTKVIIEPRKVTVVRLAKNADGEYVADSDNPAYRIRRETYTIPVVSDDVPD